MAAGLGAQRRNVEEILWEQKSLRVGGGGDDGSTGSFAVARRKKHREGKHFLRKGKAFQMGRKKTKKPTQKRRNKRESKGKSVITLFQKQ
ncbi:hypothetical protein L484_009700 [Morus notabilis]|uniref:Uncharacterized protein n=1 Tax=Morus notabilis TaxID=981085 RepID=W9SDU5_9ROSA|nr:hypothetical protein L484_009700 [Morus notabilis]